MEINNCYAKLFDNSLFFSSILPNFDENICLVTMPNPYFQFKQFTVWHDKCAMKVGTDGVLLGAWADLSNAGNILDVGTGTGLLSLMIAQRCNADITAIEIDEQAIIQANENVRRSPWEKQITILHADYRKFTSSRKFDLIVSNPPYFADSLLSLDEQRSLARHANELTYADLIKKTVTLLQPTGTFSLIVPIDVCEKIIAIAYDHSLFLIKQTNVYTKPEASPKRGLLTFSFIRTNCVTDSLVIELSRHLYSEEYIELTKQYYLKM